MIVTHLSAITGVRPLQTALLVCPAALSLDLFVLIRTEPWTNPSTLSPTFSPTGRLASVKGALHRAGHTVGLPARYPSLVPVG
eukprot:g2608.t1